MKDQQPLSLFDGTARPTSDLTIINIDADSAATPPLREYQRTVGGLTRLTAPSRVFDSREQTPYTGAIHAIAKRREEEYEQRLAQSPVHAVDQILEGLQSRLEGSQGTLTDPKGLAHEIGVARTVDLRYRLQETWRDQLDREIARKLRDKQADEQAIDERAVAQEVFVDEASRRVEKRDRQITDVYNTMIALGLLDEIVKSKYKGPMIDQIMAATLEEIIPALQAGKSFGEIWETPTGRLILSNLSIISEANKLLKTGDQVKTGLDQEYQALLARALEQELEEYFNNSIHLSSLSQAQVAVLMDAFGVEMSQEALTDRLQASSAQEKSGGFGRVEALDTSIEGVSVSIGRNNHPERGFSFHIRFSPEAQAKSATPLLTPIAA